MKTVPLLVLAVILPLSVSLSAEPAKAAPAHTVGEWKLGAHIAGPQVTLDQAKGKAVLIDYWGIHCGPCIASLPEIEKIARRNKDKMLVVGAHSQGGTKEEIAAAVKKHKLSYTITDGAPGPVNFPGIPHVIVFNTEGQMTFSGSPMNKDFEKAVRKSVQGAASSSGSGGAAKPSGLDALKRPGT